MDSDSEAVARGPARLHGRARARRALRDAIAGLHAGRGAAVLVTAEPGGGRSALLAAAARSAAGCTVHHVACVESETVVPWAWCQRLLLRLGADRSTPSGSDAGILADVLAGRCPPEAVLAVASALRRVLAASGAGRPQVLCVDDAHRLDRVSLHVLGLLARRTEALPVALLLTAVTGHPALAALDGIDVLPLPPMDDAAARRLLVDAAPSGRAALCPATEAEVLGLAAGNPLALTELAAVAYADDRSGPLRLPPGSRWQAGHGRRFRQLPDGARAVIAAVLVGGPLAPDVLRSVVRRAGWHPGAIDLAKASELIVVTDDGTAAVPGRLLRQALRAEVPLAEQDAAHRNLAGCLHPERFRMRRALHLLACGAATTEQSAADLERAVGDATHHRAGELLEEAADFAPRPGVRERWLTLAARHAFLAGEATRTRNLLHRVPPHGVPEEARASRSLAEGERLLRDGTPAEACRELTAAADLLLSECQESAARALMLAGEAACLAGDFAGYFALARRVAPLRHGGDASVTRLVLEHYAGMTAALEGRHRDSGRTLRQVMRLAEAIPDPYCALWAGQAAYTLGDAARAHAFAVTATDRARREGALSLVPAALVYQALAALLTDRCAAAEEAALEGLRLARQTGQRNLAVDHLAVLALVSALQGHGDGAAVRLRSITEQVSARGLGRPAAFGRWASACADLADDRPAEALTRLADMTHAAVGNQTNLLIRQLATPHFVEAAVRCGRRAKAVGALRSYDAWVASGTSAARLALAHRCHALLASDDAAADEQFRQAAQLHQRDGAALELAKTELFHAHRLRRARKPRPARELLREALQIFQQFGAASWAERATAELRATGARADTAACPGGRGRDAGTELTPQQTRICVLVAQGATNQEIAEVLVVSIRTVEYHLRNVFTRLGVRSRVELAAHFH
ncbi:helix-turn-helix transcriptional regulator [Streptomyces sp. NRRL S-340]|uniref:helix-turn-helix transcriptional regulator n=1 Tax=Streptomyces sp. NRRL S-340 TaxID=1463901 RepID=UPI000569DACE|nr:LuxR C-terminal-related transcriptional regulator [Streptomyces sp. NRRL S-340]